MQRPKRTLGWSLAFSLVVLPLDARAFEEPQPSPRLRVEQNRKIIILDNDYLDRRFGRNRRAESSDAVNANPVVIDTSVYTFNGPQIIDVPTPRPPADVVPDGSLLRGIGRNTPARRASALRVAETGRVLLQKGQNREAIYYLERALGMDASPFLYFYLARAHYHLADYGSAMRFLQVAEFGFNGQPEWQPQVAALKEVLSASAAQPTTYRRNVAWTFSGEY
jgi:tetratricopeptide (TPR) repeat protein